MHYSSGEPFYFALTFKVQKVKRWSSVLLPTGSSQIDFQARKNNNIYTLDLISHCLSNVWHSHGKDQIILHPREQLLYNLAKKSYYSLLFSCSSIGTLE